MTGLVDRVVLVTGAAQGTGRVHRYITGTQLVVDAGLTQKTT